jgi:regulator of sigma E protease
MTFLVSLVSFIVALGILVVVHEFGHFWVARKLGVKVLRFSVGFGKPLWTRQSGPDDTEYVVAAVPLGGYVKMLDEREGVVPEKDLPRAFNRKPVLSRIAIVAAGPFFNFLFAVLAYYLMFLVGVQGLVPEVGKVIQDTPAYRAGFEPGDRLVSANGITIPSWESATITLLDQALETGVIDVEVETAGGYPMHRSLDLGDTKELLDEGDLFQKIGLEPWRPKVAPIIGQLESGLPAARDGLQTGDKILAANGTRLHDWRDWVSIIQSHPGKAVSIEVLRDGNVLNLDITPMPKQVGGREIGYIGAGPQVDREQYSEQLKSHRVLVQYGPFEAVAKAGEKTWQAVILTFRLMGKLVVGDASLKTISGPLSIAEYAGVSATIGLAAFLSFMAIVSVSLGVINLLPVPVLDGGHLLFYAIELVKGSPVSERWEALGQQIGLVLLAALMMLAFYNDLSRLLG